MEARQWFNIRQRPGHRAASLARRLLIVTRVRFSCLLWLSLSMLASPICATEPAPLLQLGEAIYLYGRGADATPITARIGDPPIDVAATLFPCQNCHGTDGQGRKERGVAAPNITWERLTKPYRVQTEAGKERPPYDSSLLKRAVLQGIDAAGNPLSTVMPRYPLSSRQLDGLIRYLRRLETLEAPGVTRNHIRIGVALPQGGHALSMRETLQAVLTGFAADINARGGIFSRQLQWEWGDLLSLSQRAIFAAMVLDTSHLDTRHHSQQASERFPIIALFAPGQKQASLPSRHLFYLFSGGEDRSQALVHFAATHLQLKGEQWVMVTNIEDVNRLADIPSRQVKAIILDAHPAVAQRLLHMLATRQHFPILMLTDWGQHEPLTRALATYPAPVYAALPPTPNLVSREGQREYKRLAKSQAWPRDHLMAQLWTLAAAKVLTSALRQVGRQLDRDKLINALETFYGFPIGWGPPLTFTPNRRVGAKGAVVTKVNPSSAPSFSAVSIWIPVND